MVAFPTTLDTLTNPGPTDKEDNSSVYHDVQHSDLNDIAEALEAKVGINASTVSTSLDYKVRSLNGNEYPQATGGEDDDFNDGSFSGWTTVEAQTLTITESMGRASAIHPGGGDDANFSCRVKAHTFSTNDWCEAGFTTGGLNQSHNMAGLVMTNGTTHGTSNGHLWLVRLNNNTFRRQGANNLVNDTNQAEYGIQDARNGYGEIYLRWRYEGSNTFRGYVSCDGIAWIDVTGAYSGYTLTPTHWGFGMTTWGGSLPFQMSLAYFKTGNG